jgi:hypothetical protein
VNRFVLLLALAACGDGAAASREIRAPMPETPRPPIYAADETSWGKFHSKRFLLSFPLPDGRAWKIDDHSRPELVAVHASTSSRLAVTLTREEDLMNRARCEQRARDLGHVPNAHLTTVEDQVTVGPDAYDSRVWVALDAGRQNGEIEGHIFLFGAFIRKCLIVHLATKAPAGSEDVISSRLAVARERIVGKIALDAPRVGEDAVVPHEKPKSP